MTHHDEMLIRLNSIDRDLDNRGALATADLSALLTLRMLTSALRGYVLELRRIESNLRAALAAGDLDRAGEAIPLADPEVQP